MGQGYSIPLGVDTTAAEAKVDKLLEKIKRVETASNNIRMRGGGGSGGGSGGGGRSSGGGNPWVWLDRSINNYGPHASPSQEKAAMLERIRAQRAVDRAEKDLNPQKADPMKTMFMRTRLKIGPWHPLVGDLVKNGLDGMMARIGGSSAAKAAIAKLAGAAFPIVMGATAGVAVGAAAYSLMNAGSASSRRIGNAFYSAGGGNGFSTGQNLGMAGFFGTDAAGMAGMANNLGDRLRGGGYGASVARQNGIIDMGRFTLDKFENLTKAVDLLRKLDERKAIMVARDLGISDLLYTRDLSDGTLKRLRESGGRMTPAQRKAAAEYDANRATLGNNIDNSYRAVANPLIQGANWLFDNKKWSWLGNLIPALGPAGAIADAMNPSGTSGGQSGKSSELTNAVKDLTRTMKDQQEFIGGGVRARGSLNLAWKGMMFDEANRSHAQSLGAFIVG